MKRQISFDEIGEFFGLDPLTISSIHLDSGKPEAQFEIVVFVLKDGEKILDHRGRPVKDTLRVAVVSGNRGIPVS